MSKTRLTEEQAAAVDLLATEGLVGNIDVHSAERRLHAALDPKGESPNPMHKDNRWAMLARTADLLDERTALVARAEQAERDREWQPIETAPKDESQMLLGYCNGNVRCIVWETPCGDHPELATWCWWKSEDDYGDIVLPSHWMPMPKPPRSREQA